MSGFSNYVVDATDALLTPQQDKSLHDLKLDMQRHNLWRMLSADGTNSWPYRCLCSRC